MGNPMRHAVTRLVLTMPAPPLVASVMDVPSWHLYGVSGMRTEHILSERASKNLYRDPAFLATSHYPSSVGLAGRFLAFSLRIAYLRVFWTVICGLLFREVAYVVEPLHRVSARCFAGALIIRDCSCFGFPPIVPWLTAPLRVSSFSL